MQDYIKNKLTSTPPDGCSFKVGDVVDWVNDSGVKWTSKIIGFKTTGWYHEKYSKFVHLDTSGYWMPHDSNKLTMSNNR